MRSANRYILITLVAAASAVGVALAIVQPFGSDKADQASEFEGQLSPPAEVIQGQPDTSSTRARDRPSAPPPAVGSPAPEIEGILNWINSGPVAVQESRGKVVLIDFWTYTCVNCIRTLPFLKVWHSRYADDGLIIVGVHSPEFAFEQDAGNVSEAVAGNGIDWPVALDNGLVTWDN